MWYFNSEERRGLTVWAICILSICVAPYIIPNNSEQLTFDNVLNELERKGFTAVKENQKSDSIPTDTTNYNPNTISEEELINRGLSKSIAERWVNFRSTIGGYSKKEQIYSIYGIDSSWVSEQENLWDWESQASPRMRTSKERTRIKQTPSKTSRIEKSKPSPININTAKAEDFKQLGFASSVANRLIAYRSKAGPFYSHEDLYPIYDIDSQLVQKLIPLLMIDTARLPLLDMNKASTDEWESLPGIGPVYAERIVKFRDALGGFTTKDQIAEVYGIPETTWIRISPRVELQTRSVEKLLVNHADVKELASHPYIDWNLAKRIYRYKEQHFPISSLDGMHGLPEKTLERLTPYLTFELDSSEESKYAEVSSDQQQ